MTRNITQALIVKLATAVKNSLPDCRRIFRQNSLHYIPAINFLPQHILKSQIVSGNLKPKILFVRKFANRNGRNTKEKRVNFSFSQ